MSPGFGCPSVFLQFLTAAFTLPSIKTTVPEYSALHLPPLPWWIQGQDSSACQCMRNTVGFSAVSPGSEVREGASRALPSGPHSMLNSCKITEYERLCYSGLNTTLIKAGEERGCAHYLSQAQIIILHLPGNRLTGVVSPYTVPSWPECPWMFQELLNPLLWSRG